MLSRTCSLARTPFRKRPKKRLTPAQKGLRASKKDTRRRESKGPDRNAEHLALVRSFPCLSCEGTLAINAHHARECYPRTMGVRVDDTKTVPLCQRCHYLLHHEAWAFNHNHKVMWREDWKVTALRFIAQRS